MFLCCQLKMTGKIPQASTAAATMFSITSGMFTLDWHNMRIYAIIYSMS